MNNRWPHMLYRPGKAIRWAGHDLDTRTVADEAELAAACKEGWQTAEDVLAGKSAKPVGSPPKAKPKANKVLAKKKRK